MVIKSVDIEVINQRGPKAPLINLLDFRLLRRLKPAPTCDKLQTFIIDVLHNKVGGDPASGDYHRHPTARVGGGPG